MRINICTHTHRPSALTHSRSLSLSLFRARAHARALSLHIMQSYLQSTREVDSPIFVSLLQSQAQHAGCYAQPGVSSIY